MSENLTLLLKNSFGFEPGDSTHHFLVLTPKGSADVSISEHFTWDERTGSSPVTTGIRQQDGQIRVVLARLKWDGIAEEVRVEFNQRLRKNGGHTGAWKPGMNLVRRDLGKELVLLAWAIEEADPALIPTALANWKGLAPEERWWLYTQTAAATGHGVEGRNRGWRKAVRYALTENPVPGGDEIGLALPDFFQRAVVMQTSRKTREGKEPMDDTYLTAGNGLDEESA